MSLLPVLLSGAGGGGGGSGSVIGIILNPAVAASTANLMATYANGSSGVGATLTNGSANLTAARVATTGALTVTYSNGASGVGATLTNAGAQAALSIDGVALSVNDRVLVKNQASAAQNGVYSVTNIGSGSTNWVMTRVTDFDQAAEMIAGTQISITAGTTNTGTKWILSTTVVTVGSDSVTFAATAAFTVDGVTPSVGDRILVKNQTTAAQNGVYTLTSAGSASSDWVLTRATDFNQNTQMTAGTLIEVINGTVNAGTVWELTTTVATVGSSSVTFTSINISTKVDQNGSPIYAADTGAADAYVITLSPAPSSYTTGMVVRFKASAANATTTPTINVNGLGAKTIVKRVNTAMAANDILANQFVELIYDGTNFVMWSQLGNAAGTVTSVGYATGNSTALTLSGTASPITGSGSFTFTPHGNLMSKTVLTSGTAATYTVPANVNTIVVECIGGGGGGGGATSTSTSASAGGGGGAGGYCRKLIATSPAATFTYTIGTGGAGNSGSSGSNGNNTTFGTLAANGGSGGTGGAATNTSQTWNGGGGGGASGGDINFTGGSGTFGIYLNNPNGGCAGNSIYGGGGEGAFATAGQNNAGVIGATNSGAGGSGAAISSVNAGSAAGGAGADGIIIVWEYA